MMGKHIKFFSFVLFFFLYGVLVRGTILTTSKNQVIRRLYDVFRRACMEQSNDIANWTICTALAWGMWWCILVPPLAVSQAFLTKTPEKWVPATK